LEQLWPTPLNPVGDHASTTGGDMTEAPAPPLHKREPKRQPPSPRGARPRPPTATNSASSKPVEILAPDGYCADLLLEYATPLFPAEIIHGSGWMVRLQPPPGGAWVLEVLSVVERWLESIPLPCTKVLYGDSSYLIRASTNIDRHAARSAFAPANGAAH
jgi:hypothetical protein